MKLKLKQEYKDIIVSRTDLKIGRITFDGTRVEESNYINFFNLGFEYLFEEVKEVIEETPKKSKQTKNDNSK